MQGRSFSLHCIVSYGIINLYDYVPEKEETSVCRVSVIVPIYQVEAYLPRCLDSILAQTFTDYELILVNDGTKDRSMEILEALIEEKFSHLRPRIVIGNKENGGLPSARKAGLEVAEGEYILFADSDDWLELNAVERVMAEAERTDADAQIIYKPAG